MEIKKLANEMVDTLRESVWNKIDQEVTDERWNNIGFAAQAMVESEVPEQQILNMLIKYWDLQPSEAKDMMGISYFKSRTTAGSRPVDFPFKVFVL